VRLTAGHLGQFFIEIFVSAAALVGHNIIERVDWDVHHWSSIILLVGALLFSALLIALGYALALWKPVKRHRQSRRRLPPSLQRALVLLFLTASVLTIADLLRRANSPAQTPPAKPVSAVGSHSASSES